MSLLFNKSAIERALAGGLSSAEETALRAHLRGCEECRAHYDRLSATQRALAGGESKLQSQRELTRLLGAVDPVRAEPRRAWVPLVLGAAVAGALGGLVARPPEPGPPPGLRR